jgi:hypothetical protein
MRLAFAMAGRPVLSALQRGFSNRFSAGAIEAQRNRMAKANQKHAEARSHNHREALFPAA